MVRSHTHWDGVGSAVLWFAMRCALLCFFMYMNIHMHKNDDDTLMLSEYQKWAHAYYFILVTDWLYLASTNALVKTWEACVRMPSYAVTYWSSRQCSIEELTWFHCCPANTEYTKHSNDTTEERKQAVKIYSTRWSQHMQWKQTVTHNGWLYHMQMSKPKYR